MCVSGVSATRRVCHEDAARKLLPWNLSYIQRRVPLSSGAVSYLERIRRRQFGRLAMVKSLPFADYRLTKTNRVLNPRITAWRISVGEDIYDCIVYDADENVVYSSIRAINRRGMSVCRFISLMQ